MELILTVTLVSLLVVGVPVAAVLLVLRSLSRSNRVSPGIPTLAPLTWSVLPERPARLHRRLRRAIAMARAAAAGHVARHGRALGAIPELVADLEQRACAVDNELVVAGRARGPLRWSLLNDLEHQVYEIDALASRVAGLTSAWSTATATGGAGPAALDAIGERLAALEGAVHDVRAIGSNHPSAQPAPGPSQPIPYLRRIQGERRD